MADENYDIIDVLEKYVQKLAKQHWQNDDCPPKFWVSLYNENLSDQSIMITISHGFKFTEKLFPRNDSHYGYDAILDQMVSMYNRTM